MNYARQVRRVMQEKIRVIFQYAFQEQCFQKSVLNANKIEALSA